MRWRYQTELLRTLADEDNIPALWKNGVGHCIRCILAIIFRKSSNADSTVEEISSSSRRR
jgi:hypothetical protein